MKIIMIIAYDEFTLRQTKLIGFDRKKNVKCGIFMQSESAKEHIDWAWIW